MKKLSWDDIENITDELASKIKASGFKPDYIVGITNGGLIPLYFLVKKLGMDNILTVSARSYDKDKQKELKITYLPEIDLKDKRLLLIDEISDSGSSLKGLTEAMMSKYQPRELKSATLVNKEKCKFRPDFCSDFYTSVKQDEWVVFPWEKAEFPEYF